MANWKKVIVSGSDADLRIVTASKGLNIPVLSVGDNNNFVLTVGPSGSVEKRDPNTIGAAFQSMSVSEPLGTDFGTDTFIADSGLNELIFVSSSTITLQTSQSITPNGPSETIGYLKINAVTSSVAATANQTTVSANGSVYTVGTVQDINTGSNVAFGTVSASGDITAANLNVAGNITHIDDNTKIAFTPDTIAFETAGGEKVRIDSTGQVGIGTSSPSAKLEVVGDISASGDITGSGNLDIVGDASIGGDLGIGGSIFGLNGFGVTIDDVAITSGSVNFGSGSLPTDNKHKFTGSISVTGSGITLIDGIFTGNGSGLTNLDADDLDNVHNLTWGYGLTSSNGSVYNPTSSVTLNIHISGSEITSSQGGLYIPGGGIKLYHLTASKTQGQLLTWSGSNKVPHLVDAGTAGQVLTSNGSNSIPQYQDLPASTGMGVSGSGLSYELDNGNSVSLVVTSSTAVISEVFISGSDNQISVTASYDDNQITLRLANNISGISTVTASAGIKTGLVQATSITASGNVTIGGNLSVLGDTTLLHTSNLLVEDAFLILASGSTNTDGGFIVQDSATTGKGFGYDTTVGRWGLQDDLAHNANNIIPTQFIVSAFISGSNPYMDGSHKTPSYGQSATQKASSGQMWINTGSGDIWIYVD